eukprot:513578-Hanusia_phi.AAC.1
MEGSLVKKTSQTALHMGKIDIRPGDQLQDGEEKGKREKVENDVDDGVVGGARVRVETNDSEHGEEDDACRKRGRRWNVGD